MYDGVCRAGKSRQFLRGKPAPRRRPELPSPSFGSPRLPSAPSAGRGAAGSVAAPYDRFMQMALESNRCGAHRHKPAAEIGKIGSCFIYFFLERVVGPLACVLSRVPSAEDCLSVRPSRGRRPHRCALADETSPRARPTRRVYDRPARQSLGVERSLCAAAATGQCGPSWPAERPRPPRFQGQGVPPSRRALLNLLTERKPAI